MKVEFFKHSIGKKEIAAVNEVLNSIFLTTGPITKEFEDAFSQYLGCKQVIAVTSCTSALFLSLKAYGIGPGDEVITTPMTFIATPNAIIQAGATPVFVDIEEETGNINVDLMERAITRCAKAIMPVHLYGQMCDMRQIRTLADKYNLIVIEDAAHAMESERDGVRVGHLGEVACFSFYATKNITCGEGGAISTNNKEIAEKLRKMRLHGMSKGAAERYSEKYIHWDMEILGWKFNMDDVHSALLLNQLKNIEKWRQRREEICRMYEDGFRGINGIKLLKILPNSKSARHLFTILVDNERRDEILLKLQENEIGVAVNYRAIHLLKYYRDTYRYKKGMFPIAENMGDSIITLPLYPKLTDEEVKYIVLTVREIIKK
ncbi:DegT/DnrJ/EryC1/StrS aminotransferase family protein [bacterium]|nr:DegT/DnrJ/EryC1/StrS aminotransferase family protein [bacterium]